MFELISHRRGTVIPVSGADEFFSKLRDAIDAMERTQTVNPTSVELVAASAKRLLSRPDGKIRLDDIIGSQGQKLAEAVEGDRFKVVVREEPDLGGVEGWFAP
ncbi:hypothetical protein [Asticcacaulis sp. W401b]|uniref:hypothetical protein n=1 Tax=Asticcacaulis sp. W401b TaxID=3388666 RepID=UPI00397106BD